jgi:two-component system cell cycle response regulator
MTKAKILFVEDRETEGAATKNFLEENGYAVTWVPNGMAVFHEAMIQAFDVILLDRVLPDMDGSQVCSWLKNNESTKGIPIIMLTAMTSTADKVRGLEAGADDYLPKPYEEAELNARIYAALRTKSLRDELSKANRELKEMLERSEILAITDPLTGLFNRRRFEFILDLEFKKAVRYAMPLSCMMIDIDHFKSVNDTFGHAVGDRAIKDIAMIVHQNIRDADTACRWGGEEFAVLSPMNTKADSLTPARRILQSVSDHAFPGMGGKSLTVSIGIADMSDSDFSDPDMLVRVADGAMYEAKKKGRNRIEFECVKED